MAKIANLQEVAVSDLKPYEHNAKIHGKSQIEKLKKSIETFGFLTPCLIDGDMNLVAGHGRVMAAKELGMKTVPCVLVENLTDEERRAYILADNRLSELGEWDNEIVHDELKRLTDEGFDIELTGFDIADEYYDNEPVDDIGIGKQIEDLVNGEQISEKNDVWKLGEHRLMVGDSTIYSDVLTLMDDKEADLFLTDPPYNIAIQNSAGDTIANDDLSTDDFRIFLNSAFANASRVMRKGAAFYIWHADSNGMLFREETESAGLRIRQVLIWVKNSFTFGRQDYQWMHEPCLYGWKEGEGHYFQKARNIPTVIKSFDIDNASEEELRQLLEEIRSSGTVMFENKPIVDDLHPTMKPISLIIKQVKNSTEQGDFVLDLFGGSGTTLIACERLGRKCFMMEYDPKYADVIIRRWEGETGKKAVLVKRGGHDV